MEPPIPCIARAVTGNEAAMTAARSQRKQRTFLIAQRLHENLSVPFPVFQVKTVQGLAFRAPESI
jgi:hypothetical protein